jgi:hypothetical protein
MSKKEEKSELAKVRKNLHFQSVPEQKTNGYN